MFGKREIALWVQVPFTPIHRVIHHSVTLGPAPSELKDSGMKRRKNKNYFHSQGPPPLFPHPSLCSPSSNDPSGPGTLQLLVQGRLQHCGGVLLQKTWIGKLLQRGRVNNRIVLRITSLVRQARIVEEIQEWSSQSQRIFR